MCSGYQFQEGKEYIVYASLDKVVTIKAV